MREITASEEYLANERLEKRKDKDYVPKKQKQKIGTINKVYDFQFYENFEEVKEYTEMIKKKIENY